MLALPYRWFEYTLYQYIISCKYPANENHNLVAEVIGFEYTLYQHIISCKYPANGLHDLIAYGRYYILQCIHYPTRKSRAQCYAVCATATNGGSIFRQPHIHVLYLVYVLNNLHRAEDNQHQNQNRRYHRDREMPPLALLASFFQCIQ